MAVNRSYQQAVDADTVYQSGIIAANRLFFENRKSGEDSQLDLYSKDSDGTDSVGFRVFANGKEGSAQDQRLEMGFNDGTGNMNIKSEDFGALGILPLDIGPKNVFGLTLPANGDTLINNFLSLGGPESLTIAGGVVTPTTSSISVDTEGGAGTDDLDTINSFDNGRILIVKAASAIRTVVLKDGVDNLVLAGDFTMDNNEDRIMLISHGLNWVEIARSNNGA